MVHADFIANTHALAADWARARTARTLVRAAMHSDDVVYRRTWPSKEALDKLRAPEFDAPLARDGLFDSTLDLRDGLSVVEVFAAEEAPADAAAGTGFAEAWR